MDNIRFAKKRAKNVSSQSLNEVHNVYDPVDFSDVQQIGLGERFASSLKRNLEVIHQVEPNSDLMETSGSVLERATNLGALMVKKGVAPNDVVVIASRSHSNQTIALLATLFCGAIVAPIGFELGLSDGEYLMESLKPVMAFCDPRCAIIVSQFCKDRKYKCIIVDFVKDAHGYFSKLVSDNHKFQIVEISQPKKTCAFIIPTQGTTGQMKLVRISHFAIMHQINYIRELVFKDVKKIMSFFSLSYYMQVLITCVCFDQPITKVLPGSFQERSVCKLIHDLAIDSIVLTPYFCVKLYNNPAVHDYHISCLKSIYLGGSPLGNFLVTDLLSAFMKVKLFVWYTITEVGLVSGMRIEDVNEVLHNVVNCGSLYPQMRARVADINTRTALKPGVIGEICVQSASMMLGYQNGPYNGYTEHGFFKTGDVGFYDASGCLYVRGRLGEMIQKGGEMFCAIEIEDIILKNPQVQDVVVFGSRDGIVACVVKDGDAQQLTAEKLMKYVKDRTPEARCPTEIKFFDSFPKTSIGRVQRYRIEDSIHKVEIMQSKSILSFDM